jgi:UDP-glucose 4-epimerase
MVATGKRILCTGIAGFLGQNLCRALLKKGYKVAGIDDLSVGKREWLPHNISFYEKDVAWVKDTQSYFNFDTIVHLASRKIPRYGGADKVLIENTKNMKAIISLASRTGAKLIYLSTSDIYGKQTEFKEESDSIIGSPDISRWSYAISKMWGEQLLYSIPEKNLNFNIIRLFGTYGPYHALSWTAGPQSVFISQALKKEPITLHGDGTQRRCFQYVDEAIGGIISVMESECNREIFNIGNPYEDISINDLAKMIWNRINLGHEFRIKHIPHSNSKYEEIMSRIPDISKAKRMLGFNPKIMLAEGLDKTIEWQKGAMNP